MNYTCSLLRNSQCSFNDFNGFCDQSFSSFSNQAHSASNIGGIKEYIYNFFVENPISCIRINWETANPTTSLKFLPSQPSPIFDNLLSSNYGHSFDEISGIGERLNESIKTFLGNISFCKSLNTVSYDPMNPGSFKGSKVLFEGGIPSSCFSQEGCSITLIHGDETSSNSYVLLYKYPFSFYQNSDGSWSTSLGKNGLNGGGGSEEIYKINDDLLLVDDCVDETNSLSTLCLNDKSSSGYIILLIC